MAGERYRSDASARRSGPRVSRPNDLIVTERGAFAAPPRLDDAPKPLLKDEATDADFVFDDDPAWKQPIAAVPVAAQAQVAFASAQPKRRPQPSRAAKPAKGGGSRKGGEHRARAYGYVALLTASVLGILLLGVMMMPQLAGYFWRDFGNYAFVNGELLRYDASAMATYRQYREYMARDVIYPGVFVDGIHVGDMTVEEARTALTASGSDTPNAFSVTIAIGNQTWTVDGSNVPAQRDLGNTLEKAYAFGRTNTTQIQHTLQTPFRERLNTAVGLRESGVNLLTTAGYDHDAVRAIVDNIAAYVTREPQNAQILSFDYNTRQFTFTDSTPGVTLDADELYQKVCTALDRWERGVTVTVAPVVMEPTITKESLQTNFNLVAAYTTDTTSESNRNTNIDLACQAINGTALLPGEEFSFNQATGQRTTDKGYKSAGAIAAGQSIEEVGGGICQVSSTLFNAVARANLEVTSRSPHAWPSSYVNRGEDATVNWPNLDFKFKNNTDSPIFVITYYRDRKMSAEIWGMTLGEGVSIDLESVVTKTINPPSDVKYVYNAELGYGESKTTVKARTGYVVETYKVWYQDGKETKRELLHTSTYKAYQQVVEYNY